MYFPIAPLDAFIDNQNEVTNELPYSEGNKTWGVLAANNLKDMGLPVVIECTECKQDCFKDSLDSQGLCFDCRNREFLA